MEENNNKKIYFTCQIGKGDFSCFIKKENAPKIIEHYLQKNIKSISIKG